MAWIESHQELGQHPKLKRLSRRLGVSRVQAVGHLHYLWWWATEYAREGDLSACEAWEVADAALWEGDPDEFAAALSEAGFVDPDGRLHDWMDWSGKWTERKQWDRERALMWSNGSRDAAIARDGLWCGICGGPVDPGDIDVDHTLPVSLGGRSRVDNLRVTHSFCNRSRGNRVGEGS